MLELLSQSILSPPILFFILGLVAALVRSDLAVPESISRYFALYLMTAIGFKGGVTLAETDHPGLAFAYAITAGISVSLLLPLIGFWMLRLTTKLDAATAAAVAAHYGSVSMVTFATAMAYLEVNHIAFAGYIVAVLALMEAPAIGTGLYLAGRYDPRCQSADRKKHLVSEVLTNGAVLLLTGSFLIGLTTGEPGMQKVGAFLNAPFQGFLCFFLLDMGLMVARSRENLKKLTWPILAFGFYMPFIGCAVALIIASLLQLDFGTAYLFVILCASASYIAVPAAMRLAVPEAKAEIYLPLSLAVTFPFNIIVGLPLYYKLLQIFIPAP